MTLSLVHGGHLLEGFLSDDEAQLHADAAIAVAEGVVQALGPFAELRRMHPDARLVGSAGCVVMPGLINAHHHVGLTPLQLGSPDHPLELWFASRLGLRDVDLYLDTLYSAFEMIASGVTTVQHLHSRVPGSAADVLAAAAYGDRCLSRYRHARLVLHRAARPEPARLRAPIAISSRGCLPSCSRTMSRYFARFTVPLVDQIAIFDDLHRAYAQDPLIRVQIAPSNLHWLSDSALEAAAEMSARTAAPMHMHLLETPYQKAYADKRTGGSALAHIHKFGLTRTADDARPRRLDDRGGH